MRSRHVKLLLILGVVGGIACAGCKRPPPAPVPDTIVNHRLCEVGVRSDAPAPIAVGCEIADESLGCSPNSPLEVGVSFDAPDGFTLRLNLSDVEDPERIVASGEATRESPSIIVLSRGASRITGFSTSPARVPLMFPSVTVPPALLEPDAVREGAGPINATIAISQWVGEHVVSGNVTTHSYSSCPNTSTIMSATAEHIDVTGNTGGSNLVALIDGRRSSASNGCKKLEHFYGVSKIFTGNVLEDQGCSARLTVFSKIGAAEYLPEVAEWTDGANDKVDATLGGPVSEPVRVWMLYDECQDPDRPSGPCLPDKQKLKVLSALQVASSLYMNLYGGIRFTAGVQEPMKSNDPTLVQNAKAAWSVEGCFNATNRASTLAEFAKVTGPDPGRALQVFFVKSARNGYGWWCGVNQPDGLDTIVITMGHPDLTLAHEIGHALLNQGVHARAGSAGFTTANLGSNLMRWDLGDYLTLGQLSRASLSAESPVNRHQRRGPKPTTDCPTASAVPVSDGACPELAFDVPR